MHTHMKAIVGPVLYLLFRSACAAETLYSPAYDVCMNSSGGTTVAMQNCIGEEYKRQDTRLNAAYKKLTPQLSPERKQQVVAAQRLWIQYRDANCKAYLDPDGGTIAVINAGSCGLKMTAERASELEKFAE